MPFVLDLQQKKPCPLTDTCKKMKHEETLFFHPEAETEGQLNVKSCVDRAENRDLN